jgi:Mg-chelatase subunit ChlD
MSITSRLVRRAAGFGRAEDGTILIFTAIMLITMLVLAGMGLDIMKYETTRTNLQQTADRATLASASLSQQLDPEDVARDYFEKAGLADKLTMVRVTTAINARTVEVEARAETNPIFLDLIDRFEEATLQARAFSAAEQRITNLEIMLVLDVSGSMGSNSRLTNLQSAAREFVDTVFENDTENRISIGIVPFNGQVNLPENMQQLFNRQFDHGRANVNCFDLPAAVYSGMSLSSATPLPVTGDVDTFSPTSQSNSFVDPANTSETSGATPREANKWCPPRSVNQVVPPTRNATLLKNRISGLQAVGATSINAGFKWGLAMLDPAFRPQQQALVTAGLIPAHLNNRPYNYKQEDTLKIIVLMTDGEHFAEERLNNGYRTEMSPIYFGDSDNRYSIFHASQVDNSNSTRLCNSRPFWVPHLGQWQSRAWRGSSPSGSACYNPSTATTGATQQRWDQVWQRNRMQWVAWQLYARPFGGGQTRMDAQMNVFRARTPIETMDSQLDGLCDMARAEEVIVYGIAFEAPENGRTAIANCAMSPSHYFNADGLEIRSAFRAIASNISQLRLTQ